MRLCCPLGATTVPASDMPMHLALMRQNQHFIRKAMQAYSFSSFRLVRVHAGDALLRASSTSQP